MELKDRVKAMREHLGLTQKELAERTVTTEEAEAVLTREEIVKIEAGTNQGTSNRVRRGLAAAFGLALDDSNDYLEGRLSAEMAYRLQAKPELSLVRPSNGDLPGWDAAENQARLFATGLSPHEFMGARMMTATRTPSTEVIDVTFVIGWAWIFRHSARPEEVRRAQQAELEERGKIRRLTPAPSQ